MATLDTGNASAGGRAVWRQAVLTSASIGQRAALSALPRASRIGARFALRRHSGLAAGSRRRYSFADRNRRRQSALVRRSYPPITHRLRHVLRRDHSLVYEIRDRARDFEDAVIRPRRQLQPLHRVAQKGGACRVDRAMRGHFRRCEPRIRLALPPALALPCGDHTRAHRGRG